MNGQQTSLTQKTIFFILEFNRFGNSRKADVEAKTTANQNRFRHSKQLLDSPELAEIIKQDNALRVWLDKPNRCWKYGKSMRVLSFDQVDEVFEKCSEYEHKIRPALIDAFCAKYIDQVAQAQKDLGPQWVAKDYPSVEDVRKEFDMEWKFPTMETSEKLKVLSPKLYALEVEKEASKLAVVTEEITQGMRTLMKEYVDKLLDTLSPSTDGKKKKLHASAVVKLQEFLNTFNLRNVTDDAQLGAEVAKLKMLMSGVDADKIKESDTLKADLVAAFDSASKNLDNLVETKGRKFR